jgi:hypothetical protein
MKSYFTGSRLSSIFYLLSIFLVVYMPLHVFVAQSASLLTGGLEIWKAAKDVVIFMLAPLLLFVAYKRGLFKDKTFRVLVLLGAAYGLFHGVYLVVSTTDDTYSTIVASVYNTRLLLYLLLGYIAGSSERGKEYLRYLVTAAVLVASVVAVLGIMQYFLPHDLLTNVGYSLERGVKPMFFIDDRPELPRIMSTLKDPNSLGAYLILPILFSGLAFFSGRANRALFVRPFRRGALAVMALSMLWALFLTFSRGAVLGFILSCITLLCIATGQRAMLWVKKFWYVPLAVVVLLIVLVFSMRNTAIVQDYIIHAAVTTNEEDPNKKRVTLVQGAIEDIIEAPVGHGPGTAGLVSINNPKGGVLTENYYLQIAYEVGWLGLAIFVALLSFIGYRLFRSRENVFAAVLLSSMAGYLFYSLLIHLWSNEALALQWWLLTGAFLGTLIATKQTPAKPTKKTP